MSVPRLTPGGFPTTVEIDEALYSPTGNTHGIKQTTFPRVGRLAVVPQSRQPVQGGLPSLLQVGDTMSARTG